MAREQRWGGGAGRGRLVYAPSAPFTEGGGGGGVHWTEHLELRRSETQHRTHPGPERRGMNDVLLGSQVRWVGTLLPRDTSDSRALWLHSFFIHNKVI